MHPELVQYSLRTSQVSPEKDKSFPEYIASLRQQREQITLQAEILARNTWPSVLLLDHGYDISRVGFTANAVVVEDADRKRIATAGHNISAHIQVVRDPDNLAEPVHVRFEHRDTDGALSIDTYFGSRPGLKRAERFSEGDIVVVAGKRHAGQGRVVTAPVVWGIYIGMGVHEGVMVHHATFESGLPLLGDSGAPVVLSDDRCMDDIHPKLCGVFRGTGVHPTWGRTIVFSGLLTVGDQLISHRAVLPK